MNEEEKAKRAELVNGMIKAFADSLAEATEIDISIDYNIMEVPPPTGGNPLAVYRAHTGWHIATVKWYTPPKL